jgi:hypothetical protein
MKLNLAFLTGASLAALVTGAFADSATTDPVGYVTMNIAGTTNPASPKVSYVGTSLVTPTIFSGSPVSGSGSTANFAANAFSVTFGLNSLGQPTHYVEITSGPNAGVWTDITASTANSLTLHDAIGGLFTSTVTVKVRAHHTVSSVFGNNTPANPLTLNGGVDNTQADLVELVNSTGTKQIFFNTDEDAWFNGPLNSNDQIIAPGEGIRITRRSAAKTITQVGHVKLGQTVLTVEPGVNLLSSPLAVPTSGTVSTPVTFDFNNSNLRASGLIGGVDNTVADNILQLDANGNATDLIFNTDEDGYFAGPNPVGANNIPEGTSFRLFHRGSGFNWIVPAVLVAP